MLRPLLLLIFFAGTVGCGVSESGGWDAGDAQVIAALKEAGSDLSKPHPIDFYFVEFPDRTSAQRFSMELKHYEWKLDVHQSPGSSDWTVVASAVLVPDLASISKLSAELGELAPKYGGDYDGWEAAVTK